MLQSLIGYRSSIERLEDGAIKLVKGLGSYYFDFEVKCKMTKVERVVNTQDELISATLCLYNPLFDYSEVFDYDIWVLPTNVKGVYYVTEVDILTFRRLKGVFDEW